MGRILVIYGATDRHTRKIASVIGQALREDGCEVDVIEADNGVTARPEACDGVIITASVHAGGYQRWVSRWVHAHADRLNCMPTAFVSVCLGILEEGREARRDVERVQQQFLSQTGWQPATTMLATGVVLSELSAFARVFARSHSPAPLAGAL